MNLVRVGGLREDDEFRTLHTRKRGVVLAQSQGTGGTPSQGVWVHMSGELQDRYLHADVVVEAARGRDEL